MSMVAQSMRRASWIGRTGRMLIAGFLLLGLPWSAKAAEGLYTAASAAGPAQFAYAPPQGPAPVVVVVSGISGPDNYKSYAERVAKLGYYVVLIAGADVMNREQSGVGNLRKTFERARQSPLAIKGKIAVISFSLGGGGALAYATDMADQVSLVIAHYPYTGFSATKNMDSFVRRFKVPVLVLSGALDKFNNCCLIESMRDMEKAAKNQGVKNFELVVYPRAYHGFNLEGSTYRREDDQDAWKRAREALSLHHPLSAG